MKDLHSHILYGIDDGCKNISDSIKLLKEMKEKGIDEIILTPHYIDESKYDCNNKEKKEVFEKLQEKVKQENIDIKLYLGNEVFVNNNFLKLIKEDKIYTLNGSKYLLFELPLSNNYVYTLEVASMLIGKGYIPVLAHPERYLMFQEHPSMIEEYLRSGILLQGNASSLFGKYGKTSEKTLKYFLKNNYISFLGSDTHHEIKFTSKKLKKKLISICKDKEYVEDIMYNNFDKVINNLDMNIIR